MSCYTNLARIIAFCLDFSICMKFQKIMARVMEKRAIITSIEEGAANVHNVDPWGVVFGDGNNKYLQK